MEEFRVLLGSRLGVEEGEFPREETGSSFSKAEQAEKTSGGGVISFAPDPGLSSKKSTISHHGQLSLKSVCIWVNTKIRFPFSPKSLASRK